MLSARNIRFRYGRRGPWILDGVGIDVAPSEVVGLRGPSGTGKTTLAKILAGYLVPAAGDVCVDGGAVGVDGPHPVQLVFQHPELAINPYFRIGKALAEAGEGAASLAKELGVRAEWHGRFPHELSGGELQRVALARALAAGPRYLVVDEPTAMLDAITQAEIWDLLLSAVEARRIGLLAISHDDALLGRVSHRLATLAG